MRTITLALIPFLALTHLSGCSNAVTYHHSERNSIALETRATDPQQPVQGTIGIKTRTIVVTPKVDKTNGNATNVVSDFELKRKSSGHWYGTTEINSAFMTGKAAKDASTRSILAVKGGLGSGHLGPLNTHKKMILQNMYDTLVDLTEDKGAIKLQTQLDNLHKLLPDVSKMTFYHLTNSKKNLTDVKGNQVNSISADFNGVMNYLELVDTSLLALNYMLNNRAVTYKSKDIDGTQLNSLKQAKELKNKEREAFNTTIGNSPSIDNTITFITDIL